jgi:SAM-dependent methyltransferase
VTPNVKTEAQDDWDLHWDQYDQSASENPAQQFRRKLILSLLQLNSGNARVLDIGSGQGDFAADLHAAHPECEIAGFEMSRSGVESSRRKVPAGVFLQKNLLETAAVDDPYRAWATHAVCSEVLEHLDEPAALLENARAYLAPGCRLIVTVPGGPMSAFDKHIGHRTHYTPQSLRELLEAAGFTVQRACGAGFPVFNLYRSIVLLRGDKLATDVKEGSSPAARAAMWVFRALFRMNGNGTGSGWQMVAVASPR